MEEKQDSGLVEKENMAVQWREYQDGGLVEENPIWRFSGGKTNMTV